MHNFILYTQKNLLFFYEIEELLDRTKKLNGLDTLWLDSFLALIKSLPNQTIYKQQMLTKVSEIIKEAETVHNKIKDTLSYHPTLFSSYNYIETNLNFINNFENQNLINTIIQYQLGNNKFIISTTIDKEIEKIDNELNNIYLNKLKNNDYEFLINIYDINNPNKAIKLTNFSTITIQQQNFLNELLIIAETHYELFYELLNKNTKIKNYNSNRDFIPQILSRTKNDNLLIPASMESVYIFQQIISQEKIFLEKQTGNYKNMPKKH